MKEIKVNIPAYNPEQGIKYSWTDQFEIKTVINRGEIVIKANKDGLYSLANHLLNLAQDEIPQGSHMHFDEYNSLEEGSTSLIIEKYSSKKVIILVKEQRQTME